MCHGRGKITHDAFGQLHIADARRRPTATVLFEAIEEWTNIQKFEGKISSMVSKNGQNNCVQISELEIGVMKLQTL